MFTVVLGSIVISPTLQIMKLWWLRRNRWGDWRKVGQRIQWHTARLNTQVFRLSHLLTTFIWLGNSLWQITSSVDVFGVTRLIFLRWKRILFQERKLLFISTSPILLLTTTKCQGFPWRILLHAWSDPSAPPVFLPVSHFLVLIFIMLKSSFQIPNIHGLLTILLYQTCL